MHELDGNHLCRCRRCSRWCSVNSLLNLKQEVERNTSKYLVRCSPQRRIATASSNPVSLKDRKDKAIRSRRVVIDSASSLRGFLEGFFSGRCPKKAPIDFLNERRSSWKVVPSRWENASLLPPVSGANFCPLSWNILSSCHACFPVNVSR